MVVQPGKAASGKVVFNAAQLAAAAARKREIAPYDFQRIHRQADMAEFAGYIAMPGNRFTVEHQPAANAGAEDHPHHQRVLGKFVVPRFGEGKTVGVVIKPHIAPQPLAQIGPQPSAAGGRDVGGI